ncbi:hypothetical protein BWQ96_01741 [Gracilariopsis chorda]|uniref:Uncharacterized protein n=1 Tax=Gracilariopsis chorda TaxID=448386 RepID=A0A2V3J382_9FLOR|nr:hypothetical protein BWQ96_01741 [Gracilariopsis chorda]|eukprot:PXF48572.1 hypothetical protein BWQ96_01741 [Gracilariopsis chorda]
MVLRTSSARRKPLNYQNEHLYRRIRAIRKQLYRRFAIVITLIRTSPKIIALVLLCTIPLLLIARRSLRKEHQPALWTDQLIEERFQPSNIHTFSNVDDALQLQAVVANETDLAAIVRLNKPNPSQAATIPEQAPRLHHLARLLNIDSLTIPSYITSITFSHLLQSGSRAIARKVALACGYRALARTPSDTTLRASVMLLSPTDGSVFRILDKAAIEPYEWRSQLPNAKECSSRTNDATCRRITDMLVLTFVAGCKPLAEGDLWVVNGELKLVEGECFRPGRNEVALDLMQVYVAAMCGGNANLLKALRRATALGYGIGERAAVAVDSVNRLSQKNVGICGRQTY